MQNQDNQFYGSKLSAVWFNFFSDRSFSVKTFTSLSLWGKFGTGKVITDKVKFEIQHVYVNSSLGRHRSCWRGEKGSGKSEQATRLAADAISLSNFIFSSCPSTVLRYEMNFVNWSYVSPYFPLMTDRPKINRAIAKYTIFSFIRIPLPPIPWII